MNIVYSLPDLPKAPYSDLQGLVCRLIETADLSTLPAIADELMAQQRYAELLTLKEEMSRRLINCVEGDNVIRWQWCADNLLAIFFVDIFGWTSIATVLEGKFNMSDPMSYTAQDTTGLPAQMSPLTAAVDIPAGSQVQIQYPAGQVTLLPAATEEV